jgi:hypothetical protein
MLSSEQLQRTARDVAGALVDVSPTGDRSARTWTCGSCVTHQAA